MVFEKNVIQLFSVILVIKLLYLLKADITFQAYTRFDWYALFELEESTVAFKTGARLYTVWELGACALSTATLAKTYVM